MKSISWVGFYSQTGSEIVALCKELGIKPKVVVTNNLDNTSQDNYRFFRDNNITITQLPFNPGADDYLLAHNNCQIITLHGWLRIVPPYPCKLWRGRLFNGHPGLITKYPELKGKDPQKRAFENNYTTIGSVIHEVTDKVDDGKIIIEKKIDLSEQVSVEIFYNYLRHTSLESWKEFFKLKSLI